MVGIRGQHTPVTREQDLETNYPEVGEDLLSFDEMFHV
jgi:hypothetical protein